MKQLGVSSVVILGAMSYASYKYHDAQKLLEVFESSENQKKYLQKIHNELAYTFDEKLQDKIEFALKLQDLRRILIRQASGHVLETHIGQSRNYKYYQENTNIQKITGIDWSPNMIEQALVKEQPRINFSIEDSECLPYPDNTFDTIVDTFGLEYTLNPEKCLTEMKRVCKPDGFILLLNRGKSFYTFQQMYDDFYHPYNLAQEGRFSNREWETITKEQNFEIIQQDRKQNGNIYFQILKNNK